MAKWNSEKTQVHLSARFISSGAVFADINADQTPILVTTASGRVELRKENGPFIRAIVSSDAVQARFSGKDILVTTNKGKTELRRENGTLIRIL